MAFKKGQTEFYFMLGLVVISLVVIYSLLSSQAPPSSLPISVQQSQNMVKNSLLRIIRDGADLSIKELSMRGGYFEPDPSNSVIFWKVLVPYWQKCESVKAPSKEEIKRTIERGVTNYLLNSNLTGVFGRASFRLDNLSVSATIIDNEVRVNIFLPTIVDGYPIQQPYQAAVPTKLGRIVDFASAFAAENKKERFFEWFTSGSIKQSETLPTEGVFTDCNVYIYITPEQQSRIYEDIVTYAITNTFWWIPLQPARSGEPKFWAINSVNGKQYRDLDIGIYLPDGFRFDVRGPIRIVSNPYLIKEKFGIVFPRCLTPYQQMYSLSYPLVFRVKDSLSGHYFQFAIYVDMKEFEPGRCEEAPLRGECIDLSCTANITVKTRDGSPIKGAYADFQNCFVGSTNEQGIASGPAKCGFGNLTIYAPGFELFSEAVSSAAISKAYMLEKSINIIFLLKKTNVTAACTTASLTSTEEVQFFFKSRTTGNEYVSVNIGEIDRECTDACIATYPFNNTLAEQQRNSCLANCSFSFSSSANIELPPGEYEINATMRNTETGLYTGAFSFDYALRDSGEYTANIPMYENATMPEDAANLTSKLGSKCGLAPVARR